MVYGPLNTSSRVRRWTDWPLSCASRAKAAPLTSGRTSPRPLTWTDQVGGAGHLVRTARGGRGDTDRPPGRCALWSRPHRLVGIQQAGAAVWVLNGVPSTAEVNAFVTAARQAGFTMPVVASGRGLHRPAVSGRAERVARPGGRRLPGVCRAGSRRPRRGRDRVGGRRSLGAAASGGVSGVNLSGMAFSRGTERAPEIRAEVGRLLQAAMADVR